MCAIVVMSFKLFNINMLSSLWRWMLCRPGMFFASGRGGVSVQVPGIVG